MALSILDGNQSATTLSTILSSGQHITAHTVVSLGTQAITDMRGAVSGSVVSISNLPSTQTIVGTVTANAGANVATAFYDGIAKWANGAGGDGSSPIYVGIATSQFLGGLQDGEGSTFGIDRDFPVSGTVTAMAGTNFANEIYNGIFNFSENEQMGVYVTSALPTGSNNIGRVTVDAGTNRIGVVTIGAGTVTIGAGTAQIGSVTASLAYSQTATTISSTAVTAIPVVFPTSGAWGGSLQGYNGTNTYIYSGIQAIGSTSLASATSLPVSLTTLPALAAGTAQIGSVTASILNSVVTFYPMQGTTVTNSNFTSTTASTTLVSAVAGRECLTVFNEGAGNLHISAGATCTTINYQVRLLAGDYWECPQGQLSLLHTAVFSATGSTARVTEVS